MRKLMINSKMNLEEQRTRMSVNQVIEKCNGNADKLKNWLINQVIGFKVDGIYLTYPNTMTYEQALRYYNEATK